MIHATLPSPMQDQLMETTADPAPVLAVLYTMGASDSAHEGLCLSQLAEAQSAQSALD